MLVIIFIIEFAVGIAAAAFKSNIEMALKDSLKSTIERSSEDDLKAWDNIQMKLMCCGVDSPSDWRNMSKNHELRPSCCRKQYIDNSGDCQNALPLGKDKYFQVIIIHSKLITF